MKTRDAYWDNLKGVLILLVVIGHFLERIIDTDKTAYSIYGTLYSFHMPLFVFVSGFFSKSVEKSRDNAFKSLFVPYVVFNILMNIYYNFSSKNFNFSCIYPEWTLWYFLSIFFMKLFLPYLIKIRFIIPISVLLSLLIGMNKDFGYALAISRTICLLPLFLAGFYFQQEHVRYIRSQKRLLISFGILTLVALSIFWRHLFLTNHNFLQTTFFNASYKEIGVSIPIGILSRICIYSVSVIIGLSLLSVLPSKSLFISRFGLNSVVLYVVHPYLAYIVGRHIHLNGTFYILSSVVVSVVVCYVFSMSTFKILYNRFFEMLDRVLFSNLR